jgi:hypothetical protein
MKDLSGIHQLASDMFSWPTTEAEWDKYRLSDEQVTHFNEYGYLSGIKLLEKHHIDQMNE